MCGKRITPDATHRQHCPKSTFGDRCLQLDPKKNTGARELLVFTHPNSPSYHFHSNSIWNTQFSGRDVAKDVMLHSPSRQWVPRIFVRCNLDRKRRVKMMRFGAGKKILKFMISSGQIIATSHDLTPNGGLVREIPYSFQGNLGWWNSVNLARCHARQCPDGDDFAQIEVAPAPPVRWRGENRRGSGQKKATTAGLSKSNVIKCSFHRSATSTQNVKTL